MRILSPLFLACVLLTGCAESSSAPSQPSGALPPPGSTSPYDLGTQINGIAYPGARTAPRQDLPTMSPEDAQQP